MKPSQRLVLNTSATYTRSVIATALALFSSRWVLKALGQTDFGIFSVVGSLIIFIVFLNTVMAGSVGRHYAYAIGQGDVTEVNRWFNAALSFHLCLAILLTLMGWPIGEYLIANVLNIPSDRVLASLFVFRISLISAFVSMISIPFVAMFTAKQRLAELAVWGLLQAILVFILAWFLLYVPGDRLLFYAFCMVAILVFIYVAQIIRARIVFCECVINRKYWYDKRRFKKIVSFAGWNLIGNLGGTLRDQGSAVLLNLFYGPKLNAAYGIANQVSHGANQLSASMLNAFMPEITTSEGRGDRKRMLDLASRSCKVGTLLVILFAVPLMVEIDYVLKLWLVTPPQYTALFCQLILCTFLIDRMSAGYMIAVNAYGKIAAYQATIGTTLLLTLPLGWLFLKMGFAPTSVGIAFIITMMICSFGRILWAKRLFGVSVKQWIMAVFIPCVAVAFASAFFAYSPSLLLKASFIRLLLAVSASILATIISAWYIALDDKERKFIIESMRRVLKRP
ncbi:MAG TPA: oligosaccharide flippase family protein [Smithellaceae bacterium]|nr:oligosaccharide flippase family protein [Smithellaceae bacterium]